MRWSWLGAAALAWMLVACEDLATKATLDEVMTAWEAEIDPTFERLSQEGEEAFAQGWTAERVRWLQAVEASVPGEGGDLTKADGAAAIAYTWGSGMLVYEGTHQAYLRDGSFSVSEGFYEPVEALGLDAPEFLSVDQYTRFLRQYTGKLWRERVQEPRFAATGIRDTAARLEIADGFESKEVRCHLIERALLQQFEDFEADGLTDEVLSYQAACAGEAADAIAAQYQELRAQREGHAIEVFKSVDGFDLEAHIFVPEETVATKPMVVWMHGGGWLTGSWSWCGPCVFFKDAGYPVVQIEYRLRGRHGTPIRAALEDTWDAVAFAREHAVQYGGDPGRVILAGFSAGGHLSMAAAAFATQGEPQRPDAVVSMSGCVSVEDDYATRMAGGPDEAAALSPIHHPSDGLPPLFLINAKGDHLCDFDLARSYAESLRERGNDVAFMPIETGGHFFLRDRENVPPTRAAVLEFLESRGF